MKRKALTNLCLAAVVMALCVPGFAAGAESTVPLADDATVVTPPPQAVHDYSRQKQAGKGDTKAAGAGGGAAMKFNNLNFTSTNVVQGNLTAGNKGKVNIGGLDMSKDDNSGNQPGTGGTQPVRGVNPPIVERRASIGEQASQMPEEVRNLLAKCGAEDLVDFIRKSGKGGSCVSVFKKLGADKRVAIIFDNLTEEDKKKLGEDMDKVSRTENYTLVDPDSELSKNANEIIDLLSALTGRKLSVTVCSNDCVIGANANASMDGSIFINASAMQTCTSSDTKDCATYSELFFWLAHETGHIVLNHQLETIREGIADEGTRHYNEMRYGQELDADAKALDLMVQAMQAGYGIDINAYTTALAKKDYSPSLLNGGYSPLYGSEYPSSKARDERLDEKKENLQREGRI